MHYVLGIDFGGGASKATLLAQDGTIAAQNTVEYKTSYPKPGYAEQNPMDWYDAVKKNIAALLHKSGVLPSSILCVCLDAATHTAVLLDAQNNVLMPAIYWTDTRCTAECETLRKQCGTEIFETALHKVDTIWTLPQLMWIQNNQPDIWRKTKKILFAKDFVRFLLTEKLYTDRIEAQGSMLYDCRTQVWSERLCGLLGLDTNKLPPLLNPLDKAGTITQKAAAETGLIAGTPVICGTTDTALEVFAAGAVYEGDMTVKLATAGRICVITPKPYPDQNLVNYSHILDGLWYPGTATKSCAASYRWYRDTFGGDYAALDADAQTVEPGCGGLMFHPYLNGELTPYADPMLCASFTGVRASHKKAHFSRAVLEGVAYSLLACLKSLESLGIQHADHAVLIGGGAKSPLWQQIVADVLGLRLVLTNNSDSSFGGAMLAGVAAGFFACAADAAKSCVRPLSEIAPNPANTARYQALYTRYTAIHDALAPIYHNG